MNNDEYVAYKIGQGFGPLIFFVLCVAGISWWCRTHTVLLLIIALSGWVWLILVFVFAAKGKIAGTQVPRFAKFPAILAIGGSFFVSCFPPIFHSDKTIQDARAMVVGKWIGVFKCGDKEENAVLSIAAMDDNGDIHGNFSFNEIKGKVDSKKGSYNVAGLYSITFNRLNINPTTWIERVPNFIPVGISGNIDSGTGKFVGTMNQPCGSISLEKEILKPPVKKP